MEQSVQEIYRPQNAESISKLLQGRQLGGHVNRPPVAQAKALCSVIDSLDLHRYGPYHMVD